MKVLHEVSVDTARLSEEVTVLCGAPPTDVFDGETLFVDEARRIAEVLELPHRLVVCSYNEVLPRSYDALLRPVEESSSSVVFACNPPVPETFRSRFRAATMNTPSLSTLYEQFSTLGQDRTLGDVAQKFVDVPEERLRHLYDEFVSAIGPVNEFMTAIHDGNHELALRASLSFREVELLILQTELELQLQDRSLTGCPLSRVSRERVLSAAALREAQTALSPAAYAALVLYTILD